MGRRVGQVIGALGEALGLALAPPALAANTTETHDVLVVGNN